MPNSLFAQLTSRALTSTAAAQVRLLPFWATRSCSKGDTRNLEPSRSTNTCRPSSGSHSAVQAAAASCTCWPLCALRRTWISVERQLTRCVPAVRVSFLRVEREKLSCEKHPLCRTACIERSEVVCNDTHGREHTKQAHSKCSDTLKNDTRHCKPIMIEVMQLLHAG
jgi:hypothetical protein